MKRLVLAALIAGFASYIGNAEVPSNSFNACDNTIAEMPILFGPKLGMSKEQIAALLNPKFGDNMPDQLSVKGTDFRRRVTQLTTVSFDFKDGHLKSFYFDYVQYPQVNTDQKWTSIMSVHLKASDNWTGSDGDYLLVCKEYAITVGNKRVGYHDIR